MTAEKQLSRPCPICQNPSGKVIHHQEFVLFDQHPLDDGYDVVSCKVCGFVFADIKKLQIDLDTYYKILSKYEEKNLTTGSGNSEQDLQRFHEIIHVIKPYIKRPDSRILDLGCANGGLLQEFHRLGYSNLTGIDPSSACINYAKTLFPGEFFQATLFEIPEKTGTFHIIILSQVLEHIVDLRKAVDILINLLKPGGLLYVECPDASKYHRYVHAPFQEFNTEHINHFTPSSLRNLLNRPELILKTQGDTSTIYPSGQNYHSIYAVAEKEINSAFSDSYNVEKEDLSRILEYIHQSSALLNNIEKHLKTSSQETDQFIVWGTGQLLFKLLTLETFRNLNIKAYIDINPMNRNKEILGVPVLSPEKIINIYQEDVVIIASTIYEDSIREYLKKYNIPDDKIIGFKQLLIA